MPAGGDIIYASDLPLLVGSSVMTSDSATWTATESGALQTLTVPLVNGKTYRIDLSTHVSTNAQTFPVTSANTELAIIRIREDSATGAQLTGDHLIAAHPGTLGFKLTTFALYVAVATGSKTFVVTGQHGANGSGGAQQIRCGATRPSVLTVTQWKGL